MCPHSKRKTLEHQQQTWQTNMYSTVDGSRSAYTDPEVKRSTVKVERLSNALLEWVCTSVGLLWFSSSLQFQLTDDSADSTGSICFAADLLRRTNRQQSEPMEFKPFQCHRVDLYTLYARPLDVKQQVSLPLRTSCPTPRRA